MEKAAVFVKVFLHRQMEQGLLQAPQDQNRHPPRPFWKKQVENKKVRLIRITKIRNFFSTNILLRKTLSVISPVKHQPSHYNIF